MDIKYLGHASFQLKGKTGSVVCDPFDPVMVGIKFPKVEADIVTVSHSHEDHAKADLVDGSPLVLTLPGEYEKNSIRVEGFHSYHDGKQGAERGSNVLFKIEIDDLSILHCGDLGHVPDEDLIEEIDGVDILILPTGGVYSLDPTEAAAVVHKVEPLIVIPMHYGQAALNQKVFADLAPVTDFLGKMDITPGGEAVKKLTVKKSELGEDMKVVVMDIAS